MADPTDKDTKHIKDRSTGTEKYLAFFHSLVHKLHNLLFACRFIETWRIHHVRCLLLYNIKISLILVNNKNIDVSAFDWGMSMEAWFWLQINNQNQYVIFDGQGWISLNFKKFGQSYCRTRFDWLWSNTKIDLFWSISSATFAVLYYWNCL